MLGKHLRPVSCEPPEYGNGFLAASTTVKLSLFQVPMFVPFYKIALHEKLSAQACPLEIALDFPVIMRVFFGPAASSYPRNSPRLRGPDPLAMNLFRQHESAVIMVQ